MEPEQIKRMVETVHALYEVEHGRPCNFHLFACGKCGAPTFQYPCPSCRDWNDEGPWSRGAPPVPLTTKDSWCQRVIAAGGIGAWYFERDRQTVAYKEQPSYRAIVEGLIRRASRMQWPDPADIWSEIKSGQTIKGDYSEKREAWRQHVVAQHGEHRAKILIECRAGQWAWPEGTAEGREAVQAVARRYLDALDKPDPAIARWLARTVDSCTPAVIAAARQAGLEPAHTGGPTSGWTRFVGDGSRLLVASGGHLDGHADRPEWVAARLSTDSSSRMTVVECLTLEQALAIVDRLPAPNADCQPFRSLDEALQAAGQLDEENRRRLRAHASLIRPGALEMLRQLPAEMAARTINRSLEAGATDDPARQTVERIAAEYRRAVSPAASTSAGMAPRP